MRYYACGMSTESEELLCGYFSDSAPVKVHRWYRPITCRFGLTTYCFGRCVSNRANYHPNGSIIYRFGSAKCRFGSVMLHIVSVKYIGKIGDVRSNHNLKFESLPFAYLFRHPFVSTWFHVSPLKITREKAVNTILIAKKYCAWTVYTVR